MLLSRLRRLRRRRTRGSVGEPADCLVAVVCMTRKSAMSGGDLQPILKSWAPSLTPSRGVCGSAVSRIRFQASRIAASAFAAATANQAERESNFLEHYRRRGRPCLCLSFVSYVSCQALPGAKGTGRGGRGGGRGAGPERRRSDYVASCPSFADS